MRWLFTLVVIAAGCATHGVGVDRHAAAPVAHEPAWAIDELSVTLPHAGQLEASREWERGGHNRSTSFGDDWFLRDGFKRALARDVPIDPTAPRRLRIALTQQDPGYFEGLTSETGDLMLRADVLDADGRTVGVILLREPTWAPLQRSASRVARLEPAIGRLAERLAHVLAAR